MVVDITGVGYFGPIYTFLLVFLVVYAILLKTKLLGGIIWIDLIIALIIGAIFSTFASAHEYVQAIVPWFAVLLIILFLVLLLVSIGGKPDVFMKPGFLWVFVVVFIIIVLVSAVRIFPSVFGNSWNSLVYFAEHQAQIFGGIILIIIAALVAWVVVRK